MEHGRPDPALAGLGSKEFRSVFCVPTDDDEPFQPWVERKEVLFLADLGSPMEPFVPKRIFDAMLDGEVDTTGRACFVGSLCDPDSEFFEPFLLVNSYEKYGVLWSEWYLQHCLFGVTGTWGCLTGEEDHLLVGGSFEFMGRLEANLDGTFEEHRDAFLQSWIKQARTTPASVHWVPGLLEHLYGDDQARLLLERFGYLD